MGFLLLLPFFLIRFGLLSRLDREAVRRAAYFAPRVGIENAAYWLYQLASAAVILSVLLLKIQYTPIWLFSAGVAVYAAGLGLLTVSVINFAAPADGGFSRTGLYRLSRNPMYVAYFVFFLGCVLILQSPLLFAFVVIFQAAAHWIILSEERWCAEKFGEAYLQYKESVRRYF